MKYLDHIHTPADVKNLSAEDIPALCDEIRRFLIDTVPKTGGHLASNLGVTELTVAMHRVFDCPADRFIFDVGHQAYIHKIITGRRERFSELRVPGGLSGFTTRREGPADPFGAGHSSTSVSAALGFAEADALRGSPAYTVCVVGDGAYTGGMIHEALNNCRPDLRLVIILNENKMSISQNRGAFASYLSRVRVSARYQRLKAGTKHALTRFFPRPLGRALERFFVRTRNALKRIFYPLNYFEQLGLYYIGPLDGNDEGKVEDALRRAKRLDRCTVVHVRTQKGRGYTPAEDAPALFHSLHAASDMSGKFRDVLVGELLNCAKDDASVTVITAAMGLGTGMAAFGNAYPERYFDVGIAEEHALTFAAGLAAAGMKPFAAVYSTFLQRAYDNILHDIALQNLPVRMIVDRAGLAVSDGATHHGIFDVAFLSSAPGVRVLAPVTFGSLRAAFSDMTEATSPVALRYADAGEDPRVVSAFYPDGDYSAYGFRTDFDGTPPDNLFVTYGTEISRVMDAADILRSRGRPVGIVLLEILTPADEIAGKIAPLLTQRSHLLFAEEGIRRGGLGEAVVARLADTGSLPAGCTAEVVALDDFAVPDVPCDLYDFVGLSAEKLAAHFPD